MQSVKDRYLGVPCALASRVLGFIEHHGIPYLLE